MKAGDIVRNKNSESGELGLFIRFKKDTPGRKYARVLWPEREKVGTIKLDMLEVVNEVR